MIEVKYAEDKRPLKIATYVVDSDERAEYLDEITRFIERTANAPEHVANMTEAKFFALVERLATTVCYEYSPKTRWDVSKFEIRGIVLFVLYAGINAGEWPERYPMTDKTFVQAGGDADE